MLPVLRRSFGGKPSPMTPGNDGSGPSTSRASQSSKSSTGRTGFIDEDAAFRIRCLQDLDSALPLDRRIAAAYELSKEIHLHSADMISHILSVADDLTVESAPLEARKAGYALLKACASHSGILKERQKLFDMIVEPVDPSEASLQISALDRLTKRGENVWPFEAELITFLISALDKLFRAAQDARKAHSGNNANRARSSGSPSKISGFRGHTEDDSSQDRGNGMAYSKFGEERSLIGAFYLVEDILTHNPKSFQNVELEVLVDRITSISKQTTSRKTLRGVVKILRALTARVEIPSHELLQSLTVICTIYRIPNIKFEDDLSASLSNLLISGTRTGQFVSILLDTNPEPRLSEQLTESRSLLKKLLEIIFTNPPKSEESRCVVTKTFGQLFPKIRLNTDHKKTFEICLRDACALIDYQKRVPVSVMNCLADLATLCGPDITNQTFDVLLNLIEAKSGISSTANPAETSLADQTPDCLIRLFLRCHPESAIKSSRVYKLLLLAAGPSKPTMVRLSVMKLLARLRCNSEEAIEVVVSPDSQGLAGTLCRTEATAFYQGSLPSQSNRTSIQEQPPLSRQGRSSVVDIAGTARSRSATRSSNLKDQFSRPTPPLWMYNDWTKGLPEDPRKGPSQVVYSCLPTDDIPTVLDLATWLEIMVGVLKDGSDWEIYSYVLVHLPSQLSNRSLFARFVGHLQTLHNLVVDQLDKSSFSKPPPHTRMTMGGVALCLYHTLTMLLAYHENLGRRELDNLVRAFSLGINKWDRAGRCCIHALALCCHEIPSVIDRHIFAITQKLAQKITQSDLAIDILEFLGSLARLPEACLNATARLPDTRSNTTLDDASFFKTIFGICISYIRSTREQRSKTGGDVQSQTDLQYSRQSVNSGEVSRMPESRKEFPEYVYALAYQVIIFWFLAIDVSQRAQHVGWIAKELAWKDASGKEIFEEQSQVVLDMMHRTVFSDLGETEPAAESKESKEDVSKQIWLLGMSIVTVEITSNSNLGQITKRQASGTTHATYRYHTARIPEHHVLTQKARESQRSELSSKVFPNHLLLQLTSTIAPVPIPLQPIKLPNDLFVQRALKSFDQTDTVDGHKAGIVYVGNGQSSEADILANTRGTEAYKAFLAGIGTKVKLQGAIFNTQGLDRKFNEDGTHTYAWRDRATEIVFHVTTMMPTDSGNDPQATKKKRHIGNDRVKIIFNDSGKPFIFDTFSSEMNEVNIVITPEAHSSDGANILKKGRTGSQRADPVHASNSDLFGYYKVETLSPFNIPRLSVAAVPKVVSADALPTFVRQLALNASVFSQVWSELLGQGECVSSWRARLKEIKKLREKYGNTHASANISYPMPADADAPAYIEGEDWKGKVTLGGMAEPNQLLMSLDFTRWG